MAPFWPGRAVPARAASGFGDVAVTPHGLATQAALEVMAAGGNAVDGAVAANAALGVVAPETCGPGGDLFALVHEPGHTTPLALNASGRAGTGADAATLRATGAVSVGDRSPWSITVPGCVDGWIALLERTGSMGLGDVLGPAQRLATGFPASPELAATLALSYSDLAGQPSAAALYPGESPPTPGTRIVRPDLRATLGDLASGGRDAFYAGDVGAGIVAATEGLVTASDLAISQAEWVEPLAAPVLGRTAWTIPPNSQGYLVLAAAWIFGELDPPADPRDPEYLHAQLEAYRAVAWERNDLVADPDHAPLAPAALVDPARLRPRLGSLSLTAAAAWPAPGPAPGGTAFLCTADREGRGVALIQSNFHGIGSGLGAGETGVLLHNRGAGFTLEPGHPNELAPGKRPLHTLSPTSWTGDGGLELLLGTRGGHQQPQLLLQAATHLFHAGDDPATAQSRARWSITAAGAPGAEIAVEGPENEATAAGLERRGHRVVTVADWEPGFGPISLIRFGADGLRTGAADPRVGTAAAAAR